MALSCDCFPGCWRKHSEGWPAFTFDNRDEWVLARMHCVDHEPRGTYVDVSRYENGASAAPYCIRFETEDAKARAVQAAGGFVPFTTLRAANTARQAEWDGEGKVTLSYRGNEMAGECGEACNIIKKLERERLGIRGSRTTVDRLAEELADVVICADLIAQAEGIDLDAAVVAKFNATSAKVGLRTRLVKS